MQGVFPQFLPKSDWKPIPVSQLPSWPSHGRVAVDLETDDPTLTTLGPGVRRDGRVVGVSVAIEDGPAWYSPIGHEGGDNLDPEKVWAYLRDQATGFRGVLVGANLGYDLDYFEENGVVFRPEWFRDVTIAEPLLDENQIEYGLDAIAARHGLPGKDESLLREAADTMGLHPKKEMHKLPVRFVGPYAEQDARLPLQLLRRQERVIEDEDLWEVYNLESRVLPITVAMRRRGVAVCPERLAAVGRWADAEGNAALGVVFEETGIRLALSDMNDSDALAKPLKYIGVELTKGGNGKWSIDADLLDSINHKVAMKLAWAKKCHNVRCKFINSVEKHLVRGRIHASFNQLRAQREDGGSVGAAYGRMSSTDPNLQQQPSRDPAIAPRWRGIYIPDEGKVWAANDYSQQEPRMVAHFAATVGCRGADEAVRRYCNDPKADNHTMMAQLLAGEGPDWEPDKKTRSDAKQIFLGLCYGMGGGKLCKKVGLPTEQVWSKRLGRFIEVAGPEGQALLNRFDDRVPFVKELANRVQAVVEKRGWIRTISGRRCRFPKREGGGFDWTHKALNRLIQGSSADQTKQAMVLVEEAGFKIQLQVHDELDLSVENREEAEAVASCMRKAYQLLVPSRVDVETGPSWGEAK